MTCCPGFLREPDPQRSTSQGPAQAGPEHPANTRTYSQCDLRSRLCVCVNEADSQRLHPVQSSLRCRVHPGQAQLATVWPRRSPSLPQASGQLRPSPWRQPALQLLRGDDHTTAGIRAPFRGLQGALASQLRSGIKHERPCTSGLQEASRAQIFYSLAPHPHCSGAAHDLEVSGDASFLLARLVSPSQWAHEPRQAREREKEHRRWRRRRRRVGA